MLYLLFLFFYLPTTDDSDNAGDTVATENVPTLPAMVVVVVATRWAFVVKSTDKFSSRGVLLLPWMSLRIHVLVAVVFVFP